MKKLNKVIAADKVNTSQTTGMSVCRSCAACGCGGSRCVSTCKGCHDKDVDVKSVEDIYSDK